MIITLTHRYLYHNKHLYNRHFVDIWQKYDIDIIQETKTKTNIFIEYLTDPLIQKFVKKYSQEDIITVIRNCRSGVFIDIFIKAISEKPY